MCTQEGITHPRMRVILLSFSLPPRQQMQPPDLLGATYMFPIKKLAARLIFSLIATFSFGQSLITAVPIANYPQALAVNAFTNRVYVLEESANQVTEIDGLTNAAVTIPLGTNSQSS